MFLRFSRTAFANLSSAILASISLVTLCGVAAQAQIVTDGGFDNTTTAAPPGSFTTISAGSTALTGWTIETGSIDLIDSGFWQAANGTQSIDLDGSAAGTISQSLTTIVGNKYTVQFSYANNSGSSSVETAAMTLVDSSAKTLLTGNVSHSGSTSSAMNYNVFTGVFVADTTLTTLRFASTDAPASNQGIALDAISVTNNGVAAPEPGALCLALGGLLPVGFAAASRRVKRA